ncbi:MAG: hypothetical protein WAS27_02160 [Candidatus Saccharimonadales bacterium]
MLLRQKHLIRTYIVGIVIVLTVAIFSSVLLLSLPPRNVGAIGNCPGQEEQGTGTAPLTDTNKCYLNGKATSNAPEGATNAGDDTSDTAETNEGVTCAIEKVGWILCPIIESAAKASDNLFDFLADNFLQVEPELLASNPQFTNVKGGNAKGTQTAWEYARNIANIMFVIVFVVIIYSQITGAGLNNYGIKRMLPRLIVAAIAVNVSYYICQLMVDLSNMLGYSIKQTLSDIANEIGPQVMGSSSNQGTDTQTSDGVLAKIAIAALAAAGVIWLILGPLGAVITFILITCITIIIILLLRKAFIVLLVVLSPIAFVLYLLPNTEKYFSKWLNMFWQLLMVFPVVALLLGAGQLASTIILVAGTSQGNAAQQQAANCENGGSGQGDDADNSPATASGGSGNGAVSQEAGTYGVAGECTVEIGGLQSGWTLGLVAAGIAVAPLLAVWSVLQGALSAAGAIGGRVTSAVSKGAGGIGSKAGKSVDRAQAAGKKRVGENAAAAWQRSQARGMADEGGKFDKVAGGFAKRKALRRARLDASQGDLARTASNYLASSGIQEGVTAGLTSAGVARAAALAQEKSGSEEVKNELLAIEHADVGKLQAANNAFDSALESGDTAKARAAASALMTTGERGVGDLAAKLQAAQEKANRTGNHELVTVLKEYMMQAHGDVKGKNAAIHAWATSGYGSTSTVADHAANAGTYTKLSDAQFASQTEASLGSTGAQAALSRVTAGANGQQETRSHRLLSNQETAANFSDAKRDLIQKSSGNNTNP